MRKCIDDIRKRLNPLLLPTNAVEVRQNLTQLFGELGRHLKLEGTDLYPPLAEGDDLAARQLAERYGLEMKQMLPRLAEFNRRWPSATDIRAHGTQFMKEADATLKWLERRFTSENSDLYPLLDKLDVANLVISPNPELKIASI